MANHKGVGISDVGLFGVEPSGVGLCVGGDIGMVECGLVGGDDGVCAGLCDGAGDGETQHPFSQCSCISMQLLTTTQLKDIRKSPSRHISFPKNQRDYASEHFGRNRHSEGVH
jgi:hypothetical protein